MNIRVASLVGFAYFGVLFGVSRAQGVVELRPAVYNHLFGTSTTSVPNGTNGPVVPPGQPKFAAVGATSGGSVNSTQVVDLSGVSPTPRASAFVLRRSAFGNGFAMGSPRFLMGDVVPTPSEGPVAGVAVPRTDYWRPQPVQIGEVIAQADAAADASILGRTVGAGYVPLPLGAVTSIRVTNGGSGYSSPPEVNFAGGEATTAATATAVVANGQVIMINVTGGGSGYATLPTITLTGGGGTNAAAEVYAPVAIYYSPHARQAFATKFGRANVIWVSAIPETKGTQIVGGAMAAATDLYTKTAHGLRTGDAMKLISFTGGTGLTAGATYYFIRVDSDTGQWASSLANAQAGTKIDVTTNAAAMVFNDVAYDENLKRRFKPELFDVSSATRKPARTIFWTERGFSGPKVDFPAGSSVETVNAIYTTQFPSSVIEEYKPVGSVPADPGAQSVAERRTLWFEKQVGVGQLHAYNIEGRIFVEYLGALKNQTAGSVHTFLGADIVDVVRTTPTINAQTTLGEKIVARDAVGQPVAQKLIPSPVLSTSLVQFYGSNARANGEIDYYAERENDSYDQVVFYWLENAATAIAGETLPGVSFNWPKQKNAYLLRWPTNQPGASELAQYAHYTVGATGSTTNTGIQFAGGQLPQLVYQDDPTQTETRLDVTTQRLVVTFSPGNPGLNRSLLKFTNGNEVWYVRVYAQADSRVGFREGDDLPAISVSTSVVGERIALPEEYYAAYDATKPKSGYSRAGYIAGGTGYHPGAYLDPFTSGTTAAERGAIIPVNAMPGNNQLTVWWLRRVAPPSASFAEFYTPAKVGRYTVSYPAAPNRIVLASNAGSGDLLPFELAGSLYVQNDRTKPGFNPNEEHALMLGSAVYALRDDLNNTGSDPALYTSQPFVLLGYTSPIDLRPAMHVFKVVREITGSANPADDIRFNFPITAGTPLQGPMPLPVLPVPIENGVSKNREIDLVTDAAPAAADLNGNDERTALRDRYAKFIYEDRKGGKWVYRGAHTAGDTTRSFGMQFYYAMQPGFFVPGAVTQPTVGKLLPYLSPTGTTISSGNLDSITPLTITYRPVWPANAPELRIAETLTLPKFGLPAVMPQSSAKVLYQQSIATQGADRSSVVLHDPIREKIFQLGDPDKSADAAKLQKLPDSALTSVYQGKTYFQRLPPHLQSRFFWDPLRGPKGSLVLRGEFVDEVVGEDYLSLNVLSAADVTALKGLVTATDKLKDKWYAAIGALSAKVETFIENAEKPGTFKVESSTDTGGSTLIKIGDHRAKVAGTDREQIVDTATVDYALTATGTGSGWVTMVFGNGRAFTPEGEPVAMQVFKVVPRLYTGELKTIASRNPLDEKVTLRHTGDFAGRPEDYQFQWRYAPPKDGVAPPIYTYTMAAKLGAAKLWQIVRTPKAALPSDAEYAEAPLGTLPRTSAVSYITLGAITVSNGGTGYISGQTVQLTGGGGTGATATATLSAAGVITALTLTNRGTGYTSLPTVTFSAGPGSGATAEVAPAAAGNLPGLALRYQEDVDFTSGVPARLVFSADVGQFDGFALYVNRNLALAYNVSSGFTNTPSVGDILTDALALSRQFELSDNFFVAGKNRLEVALYSTAISGAQTTVNFQLHGSAVTDRVAGPPDGNGPGSWLPADDAVSNIEVVGGSASTVLGGPLLVMTDNYLTMRYRPLVGKGNVLAPGTGPAAQDAVAWSRWMPPQLVEGWIKRVLAGVNPFNQRVKDLYNNAINTDVSLLTQAGKRWEGDVALTLDAINDTGLIEIYETVLNRGKSISIDSDIDYAPANDALLLAAGYLNDLYTILGNEAYADAANPTISIDDGAIAASEVNTSRFSFESQVKSVLDEELALLRGRDDFLAPGVDVPPAYNRLFWNYTRGINSGEALYATNYSIREKAGSPTADGKLDAADAQRMFPQGHGDAYGHYLTALTGYYKLLYNPKFTWTPRSEAVTVLGKAVQVDYQDERKFADAAANLARTAQQIVALTHRQSYQDDPAAGWKQFQDGAINAGTGTARHWGLDEWVSRSAQGSYYHWIVGNALLPDVDRDPSHTGVQVIDRQTVASLAELPVAGESFQTSIDNVNARLNPLGLTPGAIAFDIAPGDLKAGKSHYEQIQERALRAVLNGKGAFDQAAKMTRLLRNQEIEVDKDNAAIVDQERTYVKQLIEIYGSPYTSSIGAGKTYAQGYAGPDLKEWFIVDRPTGPNGALVNTASVLKITAPTPINIRTFTGFSANDIKNVYTTETAVRTFAVEPNPFVQFSDVWPAGSGAMGSRAVIGTLQQRLVEADLARVALLAGNARLESLRQNFLRRHALYEEMVNIRVARLAAEGKAASKISALKATQSALSAAGNYLTNRAANQIELGKALAEYPPKNSGLSNDVTSSIRASIQSAFAASAGLTGYLGTALNVAASGLNGEIGSVQVDLAKQVETFGFNYQQAQVAYEFELQFRELMQQFYEIDALARSLQLAVARVRNLIAEGDRLQADREVFRQRAAAVIQGYRTNDISFRTFRNEALEQYRSLFDLASRYTYLAAKSYDYETGLLGSSTGQKVISDIVASRALGDLSGGVPQATGSTLGDAGLAGTMARMQADWSVAKGRLGINNPSQNGTLFSLRRERYRISSTVSDDNVWRQTLEQKITSNVLTDPDVAAHCANIAKPNGDDVPGIIISFGTSIEHGKNFFGLNVEGSDHAFSASNYATKIYSIGVVFRGYVGMDPYSAGTPNAGTPNSNDPNVLSATPYIYLIPTGIDSMRAPPLGDTAVVRSWKVADQALPLPFNLGGTAFSTTQFFSASGTLTEAPWIARKHQAFRPVDDPAYFYSLMPAEFTNSRLVGRSAWNSGWKLVIPAYTLFNDEQKGLNRFVATVKDIEIFLRTYSNAGN